VLGIILASEIGVTHDAIQRALDDWQPTKWRGELRHDGQRTLYLDFYNANPASMADSLENFYALVPAEEPRMLVLGCMEELGNDAPRYHRELGRTLRLREQDRVFVIGSEADAVRAGALESGQSGERIEIATTVDEIASAVAQFRGAVFIKGSRKYQLEKVVPDLAPKAEQPTSGGGSSGTGGVSGSGGYAGGSSVSYTWTRSPMGVPLSWQYPRAGGRSGRISANPWG
jgi:UDP-N-acetylmuramoyl-tripeptide--D-alanyl-D-alanine ligase